MPAPSRGSLLIVFLVVFVDLLGFGIVLPLLPRYGEHYLGMYPADSPVRGGILGALMASFSAMQFLFAPLWGRLSDRIGRRPVLMLGLTGSVLFYALFGFATAHEPGQLVLGLTPLAMLFVARIGAGIAGATIPTAQAYIADVTDAKGRGKGMALIGAAFGMGFTFGPLLAAAFASNDPNSPPSPYAGYLASAISGLALAGAIFLLPESLRENSGAGHREWLSVSSLRKVMHSANLGGIILSIFLATFAFAQFESTLALLTERLGLSEKRNFFVFAYLGFMLTLCQGLIVRRLLPVFGEKRLALGGAVLLMAGFGLVGWSAAPASGASAESRVISPHDETSAAEKVLAPGMSEGTPVVEATGGTHGPLVQLFLVLPVAIAGFSAVNPSLQSLLSLNADSAEQGEMLGLAQSMSALARILGPVLGIVLFSTRGVQSPYWCAALMMAVAAFGISMLKAEAAPGDVSETVEALSERFE